MVPVVTDSPSMTAEAVAEIAEAQAAADELDGSDVEEDDGGDAVPAVAVPAGGAGGPPQAAQRRKPKRDLASASRGLFFEDDIPIGLRVDARDVCAVDPGRAILAASARWVPAGTVEPDPLTGAGLKQQELNITTAQYYGYKQMPRRFLYSAGAGGRRPVQRGGVPTRIAADEAVLSKLSLRTARTFADFAYRASARSAARARVLAFYGCVGQRRRAFNMLGRSQRGLSLILNKLLDGGARSRLIVCFGDSYSGRAARRGDVLPPSPIRAIIRFLSRHCRVVMIREWMSSKTCSACRAHEVGFFGRTAVCPGCAAERNRDSAAAANMLHVFWSLAKTGERPAGLLALPKHIKKTAA